MHTTRLCPPLWNLTSRVLFVGFALTTPSLHAQTFAGRSFLTESPVSIRAIILPDSRKEALIIRLESLSTESVRIRILNKDQETVYDDFVAKSKYYGRFDVSALAYGTYTIELSNQKARHIQQFRIERPSSDRIVMVADPLKRDSLLASH